MTNEQIEVLRVLLRRAMDWETSTPASEALTAAISLAERVRDAAILELQRIDFNGEPELAAVFNDDVPGTWCSGQRAALVRVEG